MKAVVAEFEIKLTSSFMVVYYLAYCATLKMEAIVAPKHHFTFIRPHGVILQKLQLFTMRAVRISDPVLFEVVSWRN
jgi:hypothetical protein